MAYDAAYAYLQNTSLTKMTFSVYTEVLGGFFYIIMLFVLLAMVYMKTQDETITAVLGIIGTGAFVAMNKIGLISINEIFNWVMYVMLFIFVLIAIFSIFFKSTAPSQF